jgi:hypothetical protein
MANSEIEQRHTVLLAEMYKLARMAKSGFSEDVEVGDIDEERNEVDVPDLNKFLRRFELEKRYVHASK